MNRLKVLTMRENSSNPVYSELDDYCEKILMYLIMNRDAIRFNKLYEAMDVGLSIAKPTLSKHLKHLVKKKLVTRTVEDVQNVTYEVNHDLFEELEEYVTLTNISQDILREKRHVFYDKPVDEQLDILLKNSVIRHLEVMKGILDFELSITKRWEKGMQLVWLQSPIFRRYETWMMKKCKDDKKYRENLLTKLNERIKTMKKRN